MKRTGRVVEGKVVLEGLVREDGSLADPKVATSSRSPLLDAAALWFDTHLAPHSATALSHATAAARLTWPGYRTR